GPFEVGCVDIEAGNSFFRLLYPANVNKRAHKAKWLPDQHALLYALGYGNYSKIPKIFSALLLYPLGIQCQLAIKTKLSLEIASFIPTNNYLRVPFKGDAKTKFPVAIFSHGLAGMRTTYSTLITSLASYGFIVASIEHRDGSASASMSDNYKNTIDYKFPNVKEKKEGQSDDDYLFEFRKQQLNKRVEEFKSVLFVLEKINDGIPINNLIIESKDLNLNVFLNKLDFSNLIAVGHSFGACTVMTIAQEIGNKLKCVISMDPWLYVYDSSKPIKIPIMYLNSETFHWRVNSQDLLKIFKNSESSSENVIGMIRGTAHQDFSDLPVLVPWLMRKLKLGGTSDFTESLLIITRMSIEFIRSYVSDVSVDPHPEYLKSGGFLRDILLGKEALEFLNSIEI
ncbi:Platelet-activating factor acetylhydrolase, partial [Nowakowskiella sp. JEL0078]